MGTDPPLSSLFPTFQTSETCDTRRRTSGELHRFGTVSVSRGGAVEATPRENSPPDAKIVALKTFVFTVRGCRGTVSVSCVERDRSRVSRVSLVVEFTGETASLYILNST
jgi:hypothetical protein